MQRTHIFLATGLALLGVALYFTAVREPPYPEQVAEQFWQALVSRDAERLRPLLRAADQDRGELITDLMPVGRVTLGRTLIDEPRAEVETRVVVDIAGSPSVDLQTVLVRERRLWRESWRVDYQASTVLVARGANVAKFMDRVRELGDRISGQVEEMIDGIEQAIPEVQGELEQWQQDLRSRVPEWKKKLDDLARELEDIFQDAPEPEPDDARARSI